MAVAIAWLAHAAGAADLPPAAVLELPGDGFLTGRLAERAAGDAATPTLPWRSPLFAEPVEFRVDAFSRVRFPRGGQPPAEAPWRCDLEGGDVLVGAIAGLDPEHLMFVPADVGTETLRIHRSAVVRLTRIAAGASVIVPGGLERWRMIAGAWAAPGGLPTAREKGATAYRPLEAPRRARYDIALSWTKRPEFEVSVAAVEPPRPGGKALPADQFSLESVGSTLLAIREGNRAAAEPIAELAAGDRGIRALVFVDRDRGRMAVILPGRQGAAAEKVFDATVPPRGAGAGGILVKLRTGDLRIDGLEVTEWREPEPQAATAAPPRAESYDAATGEFTVGEAGATRRMPATEAAVLTVRDADEARSAAPAADAVLASFHAGSRISGRIRAIGDGAVVLAAPALAGDLTCPFGRLATLEPVEPRAPPELRGRTAILEGAHGRLAGSPASPAGGAGLGWLARGAVAAVPIPTTVEPLSIAYPETKDKKPADAAHPALVHLRNGDAFACAVLAGDAEGVRVRTAVADAVQVPAAFLRAVELVPSESLGVPREKVARLLTLPRMQEADPPTHLLRLKTGDYVRGKLVALEGTTIRFDVLGTVKTFPRDAASRLIWLRNRDDQPPEAEALGGAGLAVQGLGRTDQRLTVEAQKVVGSQLVGRHPVLGEAGIDLATCDRLLVGAAIAATPAETLPFAQWVLAPAAVPRALEAAGRRPADADPKPERPAASPAPASGNTEQAAALAAAEQAAFAGDRGCLERLGELLSADAPDVRRRAIGLLRQLTGRSTRDLPFLSDEPADKRRADALRWRQWIAREGLFADLVVPRRPDAVAPGKPLGRTLCSIPGENAVVELDDQGRETFRAAAREAYACELLPDGSRLVADGKSLVEYDAAGREVWSLPNLPRAPMSVRRLDDGHTLIAFDGFDKGQVVEYDRDGEKVWGWDAGHDQMPADAVRLPDGRTLVALHGANRVIELDEAGTETWGIDVDDPLRVERLADGTTLVVSGDSKRGWIYDRDGDVVQDLGEVRDARAGPAGFLVLEPNGELVEQPPSGKPMQARNLPAGVARFQRR